MRKKIGDLTFKELKEMYIKQRNSNPSKALVDMEKIRMSKELEHWSISNPLFEFGKREHRGGLQESLDTSVQITEQEFKELLNNKDNDYKYYCYDNRCKQILFCGKYGLKYMWLYIQLTND